MKTKILRQFGKVTLFSAICILSYGQLFFATGLYLWDGALVYFHLHTGHVHLLRAWQQYASLPLYTEIFVLLSFFKNISLAYSFFMLVILSVSSFLVYLLLKQLPHLPARAPIVISILFVVTPLISAFPSLVMFPYVFHNMLLMAALTLRAWQLKNQKRETIWTFFVLVLMFSGFNLKSTLFFGPAAMVIMWFIFRWPDIKWKSCIKDNALFFLIAPIYLVLVGWLFPLRGSYAGYNMPQSDITTISKCLVFSFWSVINNAVECFLQLLSMLAFIALKEDLMRPARLIIGFILLLPLIIAFLRGWKNNKNICTAIIICAILYLFSIFPYIIIGKSPSYAYLNSRHALLSVLPISALLFFSVELVSAVFFRAFYKIAAITLFLIIVLGCLITNTNRNLSFFSRNLQDIALLQFLKENVSLKRSSVIQISSRPDIGIPGNDCIRAYELSVIAADAWNQENQVLVIYNEKDPEEQIRQIALAVKNNDLSNWTAGILNNFKYDGRISKLAIEWRDKKWVKRYGVNIDLLKIALKTIFYPQEKAVIAKQLFKLHKL